ncbi:MAG: response regulator [Bdellovibrionota bacterium]
MINFKEPHNLVIVDDEEDICELISQKINHMFPERFVVTTFTNPKEALAYVEQNDIKILISDINMPGGFGDIFLNKCHELGQGIMTITMTGYPNFTKAVMRYRDGDVGFLVKPIDFDQLKGILNMCLENLKLWDQLIHKIVPTK